MEASIAEIRKPASNRHNKKSKQGCKTCKTRKVKCDEQRPVCGNCIIYYSSRVQECDYDHPTALRKPSNRPSVPSGPQKTRNGVERAKVTCLDTNMNTTLHILRPLLPCTIGGVLLDPFNTSAKSDLPKADQLLHHYIQSIVEICLPVGHTRGNNPIIKGLWTLLQADIFYHNVALQVSALSLESLHGRPGRFHSAKYTKENIRMLRERIEGQDLGKSISDETLSAVATLATLEFRKNNMITMKIHVDGLKRMVAMRGGLSKVRASSQTTATMIHWFTMLVMQDSIFPPDEKDDLSVDESSRLYSIIPVPQYILLSSLPIEDSVITLFERTRRISEHFASGQPSILDTPDDLHWQFGCLLQRLCHLQILSPSARNHSPDPRLILNSFLHKLKVALKNIVSNLGSEARFLLWMLAVGGVTAKDVPERDWFVGHLVPIVTHLELRSWADFALCLEGVVYIRKYLDRPFRDLWDDIRFATESLAEQDPYTDIILGMDESDSRESSATAMGYTSSSIPTLMNDGDLFLHQEEAS